MRKVFLGHVIIGLILSCLGMWAATQYAASALGYQPRLGAPLGQLFEVPIYPPWSWLIWTYHYESYAPWIFDRARWINWGSFGVTVALMVTLAIFRAKKPAVSTDYGSARWATKKDLERAGLLADDGVFLAQTHDACYQANTDSKGKLSWLMKRPGWAFLRHDGPEHVFCFAPTRSGKGVGLVIPTLVSWKGSVLVYDIKKENWALTAGFRRTFSHCLRFEPTAPDSVRFNPLLEVRKGKREVQDVQNIADILVDPEGSGEKRDHWQSTGHALLVGAMLHVLYAEKDKSLRGVSDFLSNPEMPLSETLNQMMTAPHLPSGPHPVIAATAREMLNKSENELSGVVSTANSFLSLYRDPTLSRNTSDSDFCIADLMQAEAPVSLYLVVPPSDIDRIRPLVRLILNQMGRRLTESMEFGEKKAYNHRLLMLLDEFPSLGQLSFFETELAYLAGYGIKCMMIAQSLNQIEKAYGANNSILDNAHVRVTYGALDERTAKRISDLLGQSTCQRKQTNFSGSRLAPWLGHMMESEQEFGRPLLTPAEVLQLPADEALVMVGGTPPYRGKKVMYFLDARLKDRVHVPPPDAPEAQAAELLEKRPSPWQAQAALPGSVPPSRCKPESAAVAERDRAVDLAPKMTAKQVAQQRPEGQQKAPPSEPSVPSPLADAALDQMLQTQQEKSPAVGEGRPKNPPIESESGTDEAAESDENFAQAWAALGGNEQAASETATVVVTSTEGTDDGRLDESDRSAEQDPNTEPAERDVTDSLEPGSVDQPSLDPCLSDTQRPAGEPEPATARVQQPGPDLEIPV